MEFRQKRDDANTIQPTRFYSNKQETHVAKAIGGRKVANSGATAYDKGDVSDNNWMMECKTKVKDSESIVVHKHWFEKNVEESIYMKKDHTAVVISFGPNSKNFYIIDENTFLDMKNALDDLERNETI